MRPTISLACILKNEVNNLPRMLASVKGCFDEIHLTDTGSTDGSLELIREWIAAGTNPAETQLILHEFPWANDFSKARNFAFSKPQTDYIMWMDLDDVLRSPEGFQGWRDHAMGLGDFWLATYHYSLTPEGKPVCSFARERVVRRELDFKFRYPVHEGMLPQSPKKKDVVMQYAQTWAVDHLRSQEDLLADRSRNLEIMKGVKDSSSRLRYYYGKELFENNKVLEGFTELMTAISLPDLELHDRIMGVQYAALAAMRLNEFEKAVSLAHTGMQLAPGRAEFYIIAGDSYLQMKKPVDALPMYQAACACRFTGGGSMQGPIFSMEDAYTHYPLNQLARIHINLGDIERARQYAKDALAIGPHPESEGIHREIESIAHKVSGKPTGNARLVTSDVVITCPPGGLYEWDGDVYREKGIGGSETAAVEMAEWINRLTGRKVIIFTKREKAAVIRGVDYRPTMEAPEYMRDHKPALHIAWRHTTKLSDDPYYVWCHDLGAAAIESKDSKHEVLALSPFHKNYLTHMLGVEAGKIHVTANGIDPKRFQSTPQAKEFGKVVYSSSPDRGLARALKVMDEVVKTVPDAKLHVYYGFDNMHKMGMGAQADDLKRAMLSRPYVVFHGNIPQAELTKEFETACVWLYPTSFLETYCITAVEALCAGVYPVVRKWGGLQDTLNQAWSRGMADLLDVDCVKPEEVKAYAERVVLALDEKRWERVSVDPELFSWENVARSWIEKFLPAEAECQSPAILSSSTTRA